jgi:hypothetical protein
MIRVLVLMILLSFQTLHGDFVLGRRPQPVSSEPSDVHLSGQDNAGVFLGLN